MASKVGQRLFGIETEYSFSTHDETGQRRVDTEALPLLMRAARKSLSNLPAVGLGLYLGNGARLYVDTGHHPEYCTPECMDPAELVRHVRAGDHLLGVLAGQVEQANRGLRIRLARGNVDYSGNGATWGSHESYLVRSGNTDYAAQIIPHLVSRVVFCGAGGFNPRSPGLEFTLSPRAWHMTQAVSPSSTSRRGIFHTKSEPLSDSRYGRLHLICGDSLCSEQAQWLRIATTSLVIALIEAGGAPGHAVRLARPVEALQAFARDPSLQSRALLADGSKATALEIQRHYLAAVEDRAGDEHMPSWAGEACTRWRRVLETLEQGSGELALVLDWPIKRAIYGERLRRRGMDWERVDFWTALLAQASPPPAETRARPGPPAREDSESARRPVSPAASTANAAALEGIEPALRKKGLSREDLAAFLALRGELLELEMRFAEIGNEGLFTQLEQAGVLAHEIAEGPSLEEAASRPPSRGRARIRGETILKMSAANSGGRCQWDAVIDELGRRILDLSDPFETEERWKPLPAKREEGNFLDVDSELLSGLMAELARLRL